MSEPKYVVKFGHLYSCGRPYDGDGYGGVADYGGFPLLMSFFQTRAFAMPRETAAEHARAWLEQALVAGFSPPRIVKLVPRK